jgi:hypothetical protein
VKIRPWIGLVVTSLALALAAAPAFAARPAKDARYVTSVTQGFDVDMVVELQVSPSGRSFRPKRSVVKVAQWICNGVDFHVGSAGHPVPIQRDGRFAFRSRGGRRIVLRGRFITRERARVEVSYRPAGERLRLSCGETAHVATVLERIHPYPFSDCRSHPEKAALDTSSGRVFEVWRYIDHVWTRVVFACLFSDNRQVFLDRLPYTTADDFFQGYRMAGPFVAWSHFACTSSCGDWWTLVDLRDGQRRVLPGALPSLNTSPDLELKENGSFGLIGRPNYPQGSPWEVWAYDSQGLRRLDEGNIDTGSLMLTGSTLTWVKDEVERSAQLD